MKPIETDRLQKTIGKLDALGQTTAPLHLEELISQMRPKQEMWTLTIKTGDRIVLLKINELAFIQTDEKYVFVYSTDGKKYLTEYTISSLEEKLPEIFVRIHRSCIINIEQVIEIRKGFNGIFNFIMNGHSDKQVSSSRSYGDALRKRFDL